MRKGPLGERVRAEHERSASGARARGASGERAERERARVSASERREQSASERKRERMVRNKHTQRSTALNVNILFKIITRIKLLFSNYLGRYSHSFRAWQELISVTVTVLWVSREYVFTVTVRYSYIKKMVFGIIFRKLQLQLHDLMVFELKM